MRRLSAGMMGKETFSLRSWTIVLSLLLLTSLRVASLASSGAGAINLFSTGFEASEGYQAGTALAGNNGWLSVGNGGNGILSNSLVLSQGQSAFIGFTHATTNQSAFLGVFPAVNFKPLEQNLPKVTFSVLIQINPSTTNNQDFFNFGVFNT